MRILGSGSGRAAPRKGGVLRDVYSPLCRVTVLRAVKREGIGGAARARSHIVGTWRGRGPCHEKPPASVVSLGFFRFPYLAATPMLTPATRN